MCVCVFDCARACVRASERVCSSVSRLRLRAYACTTHARRAYWWSSVFLPGSTIPSLLPPSTRGANPRTIFPPSTPRPRAPTSYA